jgi:hypothetical protein
MNQVSSFLDSRYHENIGNRRLWFAVLDNAFKDAKWRLMKDHQLGIFVWKRPIPALSWFYSHSEGVGSLNWICDMLDFYDAPQVRRKILGMTLTESEKFDDVMTFMENKK